MINRPSQPSRVAEILDEALSLPAPERSAFVDRAAAGDRALAGEVRSLMNALAGAGGFLTPTAPSPPADSADALIGTSIGPYHVLARLGEGGMGVVYHATDDRLGRSVALKVLSQDHAMDAQRRARLDREARALAALNHPNIAAIYGVEDSPHASGPVLVLEHVRGETLASRIARSPMSVEDAVHTAVQLTRALEAAHSAGVVHRDLKPANIVLDESGHVKVLDFGLAKLTDPSYAPATPGSAIRTPSGAALAVEATSSAPRSSATESAGTGPLVTQVGVVVGTAAYMSPEQAKGKPADRRADIWAFACVLFEMLAGQRAFPGESAGVVLDSVVHGDVFWSALPGATPPGVRRLLERCFRVNPEHRLRDAGDVRLELEEALAAPPAPRTPSRAGPFAALTAAVLLAAISAAALLLHKDPTPARHSVSLQMPDGLVIGPSVSQPIRFTADGESILMAAGHRREPTAIYRRSFDSFHPRRYEIKGSTPEPSPEGGRFACWAALDGQSRLGIFDERTDKILAAAPTVYDGIGGLAWVDADRIVVANTSGDLDLWNVSTGEVSWLLDIGAQRIFQPSAIPGRSAVIYSVSSDDPQITHYSIEACDIDTGDRVLIINNAACPRVLGGDMLLFYRDGALWATRFDTKTLHATGTPVLVLANLPPATEIAPYTVYDVSRQGTLAYLPGTTTHLPTGIAWIDDRGVANPIIDYGRNVWSLRLSPDGTKVAVVVIGAAGEIRIVDLATRKDTVVVRTSEELGICVWTRDNASIVYNTRPRGGAMAWKMVRADGSEDPKFIREFPIDSFGDPTDVTLDNKFIIGAVSTGPAGETDLFYIPFDPAQPMQRILPTRADRTNGRLSPDGTVLAYTAADEPGGRGEIFIQPFPALNRQVRVSRDGGFRLSWAGSGLRLAYRYGDSLEVVDVYGSPDLSVSPPIVSMRDLPEGRFDASADGRRFLMGVPEGGSKPVTSINLVTGFDIQVRTALNAANPK